MKTLSVWKPIYNGLRWVGQGFRGFWRVYKFEYFPSEKNLLISTWHDYFHFRRVCPKETVFDFMDIRRRWLEVRVDSDQKKKPATQYCRNLVRALDQERIRALFIDYLESSTPANYHPLLIAVRSAWRQGQDSKAEGPFYADEAVASQPESDTTTQEPLNAKAYAIAAELYFELNGAENEFDALCRDMPALETFIRGRFKVARLPGTFEKMKGYSYKKILNGKNVSKRGQLRPPFKQIAANSEIFGEQIVARAKEILQQRFH